MRCRRGATGPGTARLASNRLRPDVEAARTASADDVPRLHRQDCPDRSLRPPANDDLRGRRPATATPMRHEPRRVRRRRDRQRAQTARCGPHGESGENARDSVRVHQQFAEAFTRLGDLYVDSVLPEKHRGHSQDLRERDRRRAQRQPVQVVAQHLQQPDRRDEERLRVALDHLQALALLLVQRPDPFLQQELDVRCSAAKRPRRSWMIEDARGSPRAGINPPSSPAVLFDLPPPAFAERPSHPACRSALMRNPLAPHPRVMRGPLMRGATLHARSLSPAVAVCRLGDDLASSPKAVACSQSCSP